MLVVSLLRRCARHYYTAGSYPVTELVNIDRCPLVGSSAQRGRPKRNYIKQLTDDTGLTVEEAKTAMKDRNIWKKIVEYARETIPIW